MRSTSAGIDPFLLDRARGALAGAALGDALGATVEFMSREEIRQKFGIHKKIIGGGWLYLKPGYITDDTQMSLCVARAIIRCKGMDVNEVGKEFANWLRGGPVDVGSTCAQGIRNFMHRGLTEVKESRWHGGNGALMRMAPVAVATFGNEKTLEKWTLSQAHLTHNHPLSDAACIAVGKMIHCGLRGLPILTLINIAKALVESHPEFRYKPHDGKAGGFVGETFATAFSSFYNTDNFEDCLIECVNHGGDADTTGTVAGMIAGSFYGYDALPQKWLKKLEKKILEEVMEIAGDLLLIALKLKRENPEQSLQAISL